MYENIFLFFGLKLIICSTSFLLWTKYRKHFLLFFNKGCPFQLRMYCGSARQPFTIFNSLAQKS